MVLHLSSHDRRLLAGDAGDGARLAMRLVVKAAEVAGATRLIDIGSAHVGSCYSAGAVGLDFARRLAISGVSIRNRLRADRRASPASRRFASSWTSTSGWAARRR